MSKENQKSQLQDLQALMREGNPQKVMEGLGTFLRTVSSTFKPSDLAHSLQSLRATVDTLKKDTDRCLQRFQSALSAWLSDTKDMERHALLQFELRQLIRTFFAEVDGTVYIIRHVILWAHERGEVELTPPELVLLREESYRFNRKRKKAESRQAFSSTLDSFLLTFTVVPRVFNRESLLDLSKHGWEAFQKLLDVRNTITHPTELINLVVDAEVITKTLPDARKWYYDSLVAAVPDPGLAPIVRGAG